MNQDVNAAVGCQIVGEYVDEADQPENLAPGRSEVVRPQVVGSYVDLWARDDGPAGSGCTSASAIGSPVSASST